MKTRHPARGISMLVALIALLVLMIGAVAMVRSFSASSLVAGNLGFRRDLTNEAERGVAAARQLFLAGALASESARDANQPAANYSAQRLETNSTGVPLLLLTDAKFTSGGMSAANDIVDAQTGVTIRYVIDRQCSAAGAFSDGACVVAAGALPGGGTNWLRKPGGPSRPVYRVTVRVTGPHDTQTFLQTSFSY